MLTLCSIFEKQKDKSIKQYQQKVVIRSKISFQQKNPRRLNIGV